MTVIAWDGKKLVADTQSTHNCGLIKKASKTEIITNTYGVEVILAAAGTTSMTRPIFDWYKAGAVPDQYPQIPENGNSCLIVIDRKNKEVSEYINNAYKLTEPFDLLQAWGTGADIALGAMLSGKDAYEACEMVCKINAYCGMPLEVMTLGSEDL